MMDIQRQSCGAVFHRALRREKLREVNFAFTAIRKMMLLKKRYINRFKDVRTKNF